MPRSTRFHTLCILFLLAYHPPTAAAQFERRVSINQLARRQEPFGGIFGGGRGSDTTATSASATATSPTSAAAATSPTSEVVDSPSVSSTSTSTTQNGFSIPFLGGGRSSSSATSAEVDTTASASVTAPASVTSPTSALTDTASKETSAASQIIVTITSIVTNADGSHSTMVSQSASAVAVKENDSSGPSGKTWGIIGGVVGGVAVLIGAILIFWRCTQRRFDNLDGNMDEIKWPELQPDGQTVSSGLSTLNPAATRRTGRAGIEMEKDDGSEWGDDSPRLGVRPEANDSQYFDHPTYEVSYGGGNGSQRGSYYDDPYLGQGSTPYPPPPSIGYRPPSASPYDHYDGTVSNTSFRNSHKYDSNESLVENRPGVPILRVSSPVSQHRMQ